MRPHEVWYVDLRSINGLDHSGVHHVKNFGLVTSNQHQVTLDWERLVDLAQVARGLALGLEGLRFNSPPCSGVWTI